MSHLMRMMVAEVKPEDSANPLEKLKKIYPEVCEGDLLFTEEKASFILLMVRAKCCELAGQTHTLLLKLLIGNSTGLR
ncbi:unnamed protein product [Heligmosomoides polygyrus]|uniref:Cytochrome P450 n=1 Tax=Heligmosomoides polygyrus TaxID=6339 RepID=A0A183F944_HELPZ|nr:unnamed protein product [Heligmosomoides polygyrus]